VSTTCRGALPCHHHPAATSCGTPTLQERLLQTAGEEGLSYHLRQSSPSTSTGPSRCLTTIGWDAASQCHCDARHEPVGCRQAEPLGHLLLLCLAAVCVSRPRSPRPAGGAVLQRRHHRGSPGPQQLLMCNMLTPGAPGLRRMLQWSTRCSKHQAAIQIRVQNSPSESECQTGWEKACISMQAAA
jgi:hypothetical protein